jgi:hypothetical protein
MEVQTSVSNRYNFVLLVLVLLIGTIVWIIYDRSSSIDNSNKPVNITLVNRVLDSLCDHYRNGSISGDLCPRLCTDSGNYSVLQFHDANRVVFVLEVGGQKLVLKSQFALFTDHDRLPDDLSEAEFMEKMVEMAEFHLQIGWPKNRGKQLLEFIWPNYRRTWRLTAADRRSLWTLVNQVGAVAWSGSR